MYLEGRGMGVAELEVSTNFFRFVNMISSLNLIMTITNFKNYVVSGLTYIC